MRTLRAGLHSRPHFFIYSYMIIHISIFSYTWKYPLGQPKRQDEARLIEIVRRAFRTVRHFHNYRNE